MTAITEYHKTFVRAVVALAREHHMDALDLKFRTGFDHPAGDHYSEQISMSWSTGRHGDSSNILLSCRSEQGIKEKEPK